MLYTGDKNTLAYIIGVALGDGNLSNPNGRAVRLRITCDIKYPGIIEEIIQNLKIVAPHNKIFICKKKGNCIDICCYSNDWPKVLGWNAGNKGLQQVKIPHWIFKNKAWMKKCLKGLLQTDGSIYFDRGYKMVNFVCCINSLAEDAINMIKSLGYRPTIGIIQASAHKRTKYTIRISKNVHSFIEEISLTKK